MSLILDIAFIGLVGVMIGFAYFTFITPITDSTGATSNIFEYQSGGTDIMKGGNYTAQQKNEEDGLDTWNIACLWSDDC